MTHSINGDLALAEDGFMEDIRLAVMEKIRGDIEISDDDNLLEMGLDSLKIMKLVSLWRKQGSKITFAELIESPRLRDWYVLLEKRKDLKEVKNKKEVFANPHEPFPLTDVQNAYWIGRNDDQPLGGVGCHAYLEFDGKDINPEKLSIAWEKLTQHHPMLRAEFLDDGTQKINKQSKNKPLLINDLRIKKLEEISIDLEGIRNRLSHRKLKVEEGEVAGLELSLLPGGSTRLHFDLDLLIADVQSLEILLRDLGIFYMGKGKPEAPSNWNFAQYLFDESENSKKEKIDAKEYWTARLEDFSGAPGLPLKNQPESIGKPVFKRRKYLLEKKYFESFKNHCANFKITPAMGLLAIYAEVLNRWSSNDKFLINIPLFDRQLKEESIENVVSDFTNLLLLETDFESKNVFLVNAEKIQSQFHKDVAHSSYSGVEIQRDITKLKKGRQMTAPVVFACNLGNQFIDAQTKDLFGEMSYMISQTPQVWLDFQIYEMEEGLLLTWDAVEDLFPEDMLDLMFESYIDFINLLAKDKNAWSLDFSDLVKVKYPENFKIENIEEDVSMGLLHNSFEKNVTIHPEKDALVTNSESLSYKELNEISNGIANLLIKEQITPGKLVGVVMERGWEQVAGAFGILKSGGAYLPLDSSIPESRLELILKDADVDIVLIQPQLKNKIEIPENIKIIEVEKKIAAESLPANFENKADVNDLAYVIYTSGSTGKPKGVMIDHAGALNTISDINKRFNVSSNDKVISLAAMNFDLSVYDYFGVLGAGGTIVIPDQDKANDPEHWLELMEKEKITIWNSVPQLMQMLTDYLPVKPEFKSKDLRLIMMSGDWIPLSLPKKIRENFIDPQIISLGGATEASIWSIIYPIEEIDETWKSIPYGRAMVNQKVVVLNKNFDLCPAWVTGDIYIGGKGLAKGYLNDNEKTKALFIINPETGERLYRTGDLGRYFPDGNIEFLGRDDFQVKINGYRIEFGEIEEILKQHDDVKDAVVYTDTDLAADKKLFCSIIAKEDKESSLFELRYADSKDSEDLLKKLSINADIAMEKFPRDEESKFFLDFWEKMEQLGSVLIFSTLNKLGVCKEKREVFSVDSVMKLSGILPVYKKLLNQWFNILEKNKILKKIDLQNYVNTLSLEEIFDERLLTEVECIAQKNDNSKKLFYYIKNCYTNHLAMLRGHINPIEIFFPSGSWEIAEALYQNNPVSKYYNGIVSSITKTIVDSKLNKNEIKIVEVGAGTGGTTSSILPLLPPDKTSYYHTDLTDFFKNESKNKFKSYPFIEFEKFDINKSPMLQSLELNSFDILIAVNVLHDAHNINKTLDYLKLLLKPDGFLIILEGTENTNIQMISFGFIEGLNLFEDERVKTNLPLLASKDWIRHIRLAGFKNITAYPGDNYRSDSFINHSVIVAQAPLSIKSFKSSALKEFLKQRVPDYMVPEKFFLLENFPLTANGKINRASLPVVYEEKFDDQNLFEHPQTDIEVLIEKIWRRILKKKISINSNFFDIGGDSLIGTRIVAIIREETGLEISLRILFEFPTIKELSQQIKVLSEENSPSYNEELKIFQVIPDNKNIYQPFPVTDVQSAYILGRNSLYELGNVGAHCYFEFDGFDPDIENLNTALHRLIKHHPMMRSVFLHEKMEQVILKNVPDYKIEVSDLRGISNDEANKEMIEIRNLMSHQKILTDEWPLFDIKISLFNQNCFRLHISLDNSVFDGWSMFHLLSEMSRLYKNPDAELKDIEATFRDYVLGLEKIKYTDLYIRDKKYWLSRLDSLPSSPELPMNRIQKTDKDYSFTRFQNKIKKETWIKLKDKVKASGITPSGLLLTAYAEVLNSRSSNDSFTINLTTFNRIPLHRDVSKIMGDFTSLTLLEINYEIGFTFQQKAQNLQKQLWEDMGHPYFSGIEVLRELAKVKGGIDKARMPIVFTSALGITTFEEDDIENNGIGHLNYSISQTPQVLLDHQVYEASENLVLVWDVVKEFFPDGFIEDMFNSYIELLNSLAEQEDAFEKISPVKLPEKQKKKRIELNLTESEVPKIMLHSLFEENVIKNPEAEAIITSGRRLSYKDLSLYSEKIAQILINENVIPNTLVAVYMDKGWEQIAAVAGILKAGAAYLPVSGNTPIGRLKNIFNDANVKVVLTQSWLENKLKPESDLRLFSIDEIESVNPVKKESCLADNNENLAYVIYTSGSTGKPKGVMIDHKGALNTVLDINKRFFVNPGDKVLALSELNFDLSVYDIFGILSAGGSTVIPDPEIMHDPEYWIDLIKSEQITVWNSVPQFMQMLIDYLGDNSGIVFQSLRLVLLSGDWIPVDLPGKIKSVFKSAEIISLGGATEASIWSIFYPIENIDPHWKSIPYGKPLSNQKIYIMDRYLKNCPDWVTGSIYIGGTGLAKGYWADSEKTESSFFIHPETGEKLYKTGDMGRYLPDGNVEFFGREDFQVKINGYRVELGEVEASINNYPGVKKSLAHVFTDKAGSRYLVGYIIAKDDNTIFEQDLNLYLKQNLPDYMIPSFYLMVSSFPISSNGKVDRNRLQDPISGNKKDNKEYIAPKTELELKITKIFEDVTGLNKIGVGNNFFDLGVNSIHLVTIQSILKNKLNTKINTVDLFRYPTIYQLAEYLIGNKKENTSITQADEIAQKRNSRRGRRVKLSGN